MNSAEEKANAIWDIAGQRRKRDGGSTGGGGDDTFSGMEPRVRKLEDTMTEIRVKLDHLATRDDLTGLKVDVAEVKARLSHMPSTWQMIGVFAAMTGLFAGGATLVIAVSRLFGTPTP